MLILFPLKLLLVNLAVLILRQNKHAISSKDKQFLIHCYFLISQIKMLLPYSNHILAVTIVNLVN